MELLLNCRCLSKDRYLESEERALATLYESTTVLPTFLAFSSCDNT